jgi:hypothetical protein
LWFIVALLSLAVVFILLLSVPVDVVLRVDSHGKPKFSMRLVWLFGLVTREISKSKKKPEEKIKSAGERQKPGKRKIGAIFEILRTRGLLNKCRGLLWDIFSRLKFWELEGNFKVGLDNPADTGLLFAIVGTSTSLLKIPVLRHIRIEPSFEDKVVFYAYLRGAVRLQPVQILLPFIRFTVSLTTFRVLRKLVLLKWKRNRLTRT